MEAGYHVGGLGGRAGVGGDEQAGVVVNDVEDVDLDAAGELPVGEVGLPALVGHGCFEADRGAAGALVGLGGDESSLGQDAPDRGWRWGVAVPLGEVVGNGVGTGVQALVGEPLAQLADLLDEPLRGPPGLAWGRRDRATRPASPSASKRLTSSCTHRRDTR